MALGTWKHGRASLDRATSEIGPDGRLRSLSRRYPSG